MVHIASQLCTRLVCKSHKFVGSNLSCFLFLLIYRNREQPVEGEVHHLQHKALEEAAVHGQPLDPLVANHQRLDHRHHNRPPIKLPPLLFNSLLRVPLQISHPVGHLALNSSKGHSSKFSDRVVNRLAALCPPGPPTAIQSLSRNKDQSQAYETLSSLILLQHLHHNSSSTMLHTTVLGLLVTISHPPLLHTHLMHKRLWGLVVGGML